MPNWSDDMFMISRRLAYVADCVAFELLKQQNPDVALDFVGAP